jgi:hypothetical protein
MQHCLFSARMVERLHEQFPVNLGCHSGWLFAENGSTAPRQYVKRATTPFNARLTVCTFQNETIEPLASGDVIRWSHLLERPSLPSDIAQVGS